MADLAEGFKKLDEQMAKLKEVVKVMNRVANMKDVSFVISVCVPNGPDDCAWEPYDDVEYKTMEEAIKASPACSEVHRHITFQDGREEWEKVWETEGPY